MRIEQAIKKFEGQLLTKQILLDLLKDYKRPNDKINELVKQQVLLPVKRGLFIPGKGIDLSRPGPFLIANYLMGPSYVSMESALAYWRLIPEFVYEISSATTKRSKIYYTAAGRYSYTYLPLPYYAFGQQPVTIAPMQVVLMATPEKALCDKLITTSGLLFRSVVQTSEWLTEDLRIDEELLRSLDADKIEDWIKDAPKKESLRLLVKALKNL